MRAYLFVYIDISYSYICTHVLKSYILDYIVVDVYILFQLFMAAAAVVEVALLPVVAVVTMQGNCPIAVWLVSDYAVEQSTTVGE